ncbi:MAG: hypothetical protein ACK5IB_04530 [Qingshengfaniella sp.]
MKLFKVLFYLIVLAALGLLAFAYLGDLSPNQTEIRIPIQIDGP